MILSGIMSVAVLCNGQKLHALCILFHAGECVLSTSTYDDYQREILSSSLLFGRQAIRGRGHTVQQRNNLRLQSKESSQVRIKTSKVCTWDIHRFFLH